MMIPLAFVWILTVLAPAALAPPAGAQVPDTSPGASQASPEERIAQALGRRSFTAVVAGASWYESNGEFMRLEPIDPPVDDSPVPDQGWVVAVSAVGRAESVRDDYRFLFRDGAVVGGEHTTYTTDGAVARRRRVNDTGEEVLSEHMTYRGDGTVRSIRRCHGEECLTARFSPPGEGGEESIIGDSLAMLIRFSTTARPEYIRIDRDGAVTEEFLTYGEEGLSERRVVRGDTEITTTYADGLLLTEEERQGERVVRRLENTYDEQGRPVLQVEIRRNLRRETRWSYKNGDDYVMERFENEALVLREEFTGDTTIRTHFRGGDPVFRETEVAGEVTRREIFVDGAFVVEDPS
ncbi:MAG: hypothetical protein WD492_17000 [Alkalispirochaeta sp.]